MIKNTGNVILKNGRKAIIVHIQDGSLPYLGDGDYVLGYRENKYGEWFKTSWDKDGVNCDRSVWDVSKIIEQPKKKPAIRKKKNDTVSQEQVSVSEDTENSGD